MLREVDQTRFRLVVTFSLPPPTSITHTKCMHRCLQIQELLSIIFRYVRIQETLARIARTCTDFQDPALNMLWHSQSILLPLYECLPQDAWVIKKKKLVRNSLGIKSRPIFEHVQFRVSPGSLPHLTLEESISIVIESKFFVSTARILILKIKSQPLSGHKNRLQVLSCPMCRRLNWMATLYDPITARLCKVSRI